MKNLEFDITNLFEKYEYILFFCTRIYDDKKLEIIAGPWLSDAFLHKDPYGEEMLKEFDSLVTRNNCSWKFSNMKIIIKKNN